VSGGFQPFGFQGPPGFQQTGDVTGEVSQTVPSFTQTGDVFVEGLPAPDLPSEVLGAAFRFRHPEIRFDNRAVIVQTMPSFTQELAGTVDDLALILLLV